MKPRRTIIGAAALSLAVAGSLAGAGSAKADDHDVVCGRCDFSPRVAAISSVLQKIQSDPIFKFDTPFFKLETAFDNLSGVLFKWPPG